ncbi:cytosolic protein [Ectobacillus sp. JY-23]|uniref:cytosolic protein n=1 Tax=Ectobacillus sp. JY-23 TaxID=2933872 RepID=UPI001FF15FBF|nr:cytosolic protein [Ectobacillus sp. JY-23]UOY94266.1 cytosolic protein [Ectobacillus sp. JY-23]
MLTARGKRPRIGNQQRTLTEPLFQESKETCMGLIANVKQFFTTQAETADTHRVDELRTRYYKTNTTGALKAVEELLKAVPHCNVTSVQMERGEVSAVLNGKVKAHVVATIVTIRPFETAVDFMVYTETALPSDFGFSRRTIKELYKQLDKKIVFVGTSLAQKL